jgi:hypothetical protein
VAPCPDCGIDEETISVTDAVAAIRSFPRRYREALDAVPRDRLAVRPDPSTWSIIEYAVHAREVLEILSMLLPEVLDHPGLALPDMDDEVDRGGPPPTFPDWLTDRDLVLAGIQQASGALAARADEAPLSAWDRPFTIGNHEHVASWIVQHAAHEGGHHLRDIERVARALGISTEE